MEGLSKRYILDEYEKACNETDPIIRKLRLAFCLVMVEDKKLLEALGSL